MGKYQKMQSLGGRSSSLYNAISNTGDVEQDEQRKADLKGRGKLLLQKSCQAPAPMKDTFYLSIYQNQETGQIRIYADELKCSPSSLSLSKSARPGTNGPIEAEEYLNDKQVQQQTIGLFGKEIADEINNFIQQESGITVQD